MPDLVVSGTIGLDDIQTPFGKQNDLPGGSAIYAALAASKFCQVGLVSIVGADFNAKWLNQLSQLIDTEGVQISGQTLRWSAKYDSALNEAQILETKLNNIVRFKPELPEHFRGDSFHLLANLDPDKQNSLIDQIAPRQRFVAADTMNFWISSKRQGLKNLIKRINLFILNESEARQLFDTPNLIRAGGLALEFGPEYIVIKKGEHGALLFSKQGIFSIGGYPLEAVVDPTGAGDSFAGALIGYLANQYRDFTNLTVSEPMMRKAMAVASATASFTTEGFGLCILQKVTLDEIKERYEILKKLHQF